MSTIIALHDAGIIKWINPPSMVGMARFRVEIRDDIDQSQLTDYKYRASPSKCLKSSVMPDVWKVVKVESVKGRITNWIGAIVYATKTTTPTELWKKFLATTRRSFTSRRRYRILFEFDFFRETWVPATKSGRRILDWGPLDGAFSTSNVVEALRDN